MAKKDITNRVFGNLIVLSFSHTDEHRKSYWLCKCTCGVEKAIAYQNLLRGRTKTCGCGQHYGQKDKPAHNRIDLSGKRFNQLLVLKYDHTDEHRQAHWLCRCDCGNEKAINKGNLFAGQIDCGHKHNLPDGQASFNNLLRRYKTEAKNNGREFKLTIDEFRDLTSSNCWYCGQSPVEGSIDNEWCKGIYPRNGIDRVDNNLGYTSGNCVPSCTACNISKHKSTREAYIARCHRIVKLHPE